MSDIRLYNRADSAGLSVLLAEAFLDGPIAEYLVPDRDTRWHIYVKYFRIFTDHVLEHGLAYGTPDLSGAALWLDATEGTFAPIADFPARLDEACGTWAPRFGLLDQVLGRVHPHTPHWYLVFLGVKPAWQRRGIGSDLLNFHHEVLDAHRQPSFLEASNPRNRELYLRHGYENLIPPEELPGGGPPIWPMWREPQR